MNGTDYAGAVDLNLRYSWHFVLFVVDLERNRQTVFEKRRLRRIFGPKEQGVTDDWRKIHNEELSKLYSRINTIRMVESRIIRPMGSVARTGR